MRHLFTGPEISVRWRAAENDANVKDCDCNAEDAAQNEPMPALNLHVVFSQINLTTSRNTPHYSLILT